MVQIALSSALFICSGLICFAYSSQTTIKHFLNDVNKQQPSGPEKAALLDIQHDAATCMSFYGIVIANEKKSGDSPALIAKQQANYRLASMLTSGLGNKVGLIKVSLEAQQKMEYQKIFNFSGRNWTNMPMVVKKYEPVCRQTIHDPKARLSYWKYSELKRGHASGK